MTRSSFKEAGAAVLLIAIALPFTLTVDQIYVDPSDPGFGARDLPRYVTYALLALAGFLIIKFARHAKFAHTFTMAKSAIWNMRAVIGLGTLALAYIWAIRLFQYAIPTLIALAILFYLFGNRGWKALIAAPVVLVGIYYLVFFIIFGIYEDPGLLLSYDSYTFAQAIRNAIGL